MLIPDSESESLPNRPGRRIEGTGKIELGALWASYIGKRSLILSESFLQTISEWTGLADQVSLRFFEVLNSPSEVVALNTKSICPNSGTDISRKGRRENTSFQL
jgi:hypothetical protein